MCSHSFQINFKIVNTVRKNVFFFIFFKGKMILKSVFICCFFVLSLPPVYFNR